ncbi:MAG: hypothetical protein QHC90_07625 [Shinella sp.]|nr:hypothetical protein [Shinella sp.]
MSVVENERTKLMANAIDRASTACLTVGILTPIAGYLYNLGGLRDGMDVWMTIGLAGWLLTALVLHYIARQVLKGLKP